MITMTVADFSRDIEKIIDIVESTGEEVLLVRNKKNLAKLVPPVHGYTAKEVFSDLYRVLPDTAGDGWIEDSRSLDSVSDLRNPWAT